MDQVKAAQLFGKVAAQGYALAQYCLGSCYCKGVRVEVDKVKAAQLLEKAAAKGGAPAQYALGTCYFNGKGVELNEVQAVLLYSQAAGQDHADAQGDLGVCYAQGYGLKQDLTEAVVWYRRAIDGGLAEASAYLGLCFEKGRGVPRDLDEAELLYALAARTGPTRNLVFAPNPVKNLDLITNLHLPLQGLAAASTPVDIATARAHIRRAVYGLNILVRMGDRYPLAAKLLQTLFARRDIVSVCCLGCGAAHKLKTCSKCRVARFCDMECTARV
jgi:hypothetical protein